MSKKKFEDQMGRSVEINFPPKRIISLVPSQTELLHYLGLEVEVIGITKFCIHPDTWFRNKTRIGGTKTVKPEKIESLKPDLIIGNKEENQKDQIEALSNEYPVWMSDIKTIDDAFEMIEKIGVITDRKDKALSLSNQLRHQFSNHEKTVRSQSLKSAAYFIWKSPYMVAGNGTFINEMMQSAGFSNVFQSIERYPEISLEDLKEKQPEVILLSSEPYPFKEKHIEEFQNVVPKASIQIVDGELFSWYGSRLLFSIDYFQALYMKI